MEDKSKKPGARPAKKVKHDFGWIGLIVIVLVAAAVITMSILINNGAFKQPAAEPAEQIETELPADSPQTEQPF
jgi:hypothetical protein